mgnify:FL=1
MIFFGDSHMITLTKNSQRNNQQQELTERAMYCTRLSNRFEHGFQTFLDELRSFNERRLSLQKDFHEKILEQLSKLKDDIDGNDDHDDENQSRRVDSIKR